MRYHRLLIAILATLVTAPLAAQIPSTPTLPPAARVRVESASGVLVGTTHSVTDSAIVVEAAGAKTAFLWSSVRRLEISRGRSTNAWRGLGYGVLGGAVIGAIAGFASGEDCSRSRSFICFDRGSLAVAGAVGFGVVGGVLGMVAGAFGTHENWHRVAVPRRTRRVSLGPRGAGLAVAVHF